jgi:cytochrome c-type biogenesis protein CcmF
MIGTMVIWITFGAALISVWSYYHVATAKRDSLKLARGAFHVTVVGAVLSSLLLLAFILQHRFEYAYVYSYSSRSLPFFYLLSTFYAGQEGSFLFWTLAGSIIGIFLLKYTQRKRIEAEVMAVYVSIQAFLLLLLIAKSPFRSIWDAFPGQIALGSVPSDGHGLNPLLQNFWMVVHPPVLFIGFAAMAVPFSFAVAGLWRRKYQEWLASAFPWILFAVLALGAGIMLGAYWAYGVLGWGGYWGWDPVENSSLIPWLTAVALTHTVLVQKRTGGLKRTNFVLAIISFLLVLYSTFLTRSGILGDSSVHSFVDPGSAVYLLLIAFIVTFAALGFGLCWQRRKELKTAGERSSLLSREAALAVGAVVICASAVAILFGTSLPIISKTTVEPSFYDQMNLPIAIIVAFLNGLALLLKWKTTGGKDIIKRSGAALVVAVGITGVLVYLGMRDTLIALLLFSAAFALLVNVDIVLRVARGNARFAGAYLAHVGLSLVFLGIIGSGKYSQKENVALRLHSPRKALGYTLTYLGSKPTDNGRYEFDVQVEKNGKKFVLAPVMFRSQYSNETMRNPDIAMFLTKDFYISPVSVEDEREAGHDGETYHLKKGVATSAGDLMLTFTGFEMNHNSEKNMMSGSGFAIGADIEVKRGGTTEAVVPVTIYREGNTPTYQSAPLKDGKTSVQLLHVNVDMTTKESSIAIAVHRDGQDARSEKDEVLVVEASVKPFISLLWSGTVILFVGFIVSIIRRAKEAHNEKR